MVAVREVESDGLPSILVVGDVHRKAGIHHEERCSTVAAAQA